jgi:hypothetical protein
MYKCGFVIEPQRHGVNGVSRGASVFLCVLCGSVVQKKFSKEQKVQVCDANEDE